MLWLIVIIGEDSCRKLYWSFGCGLNQEDPNYVSAGVLRRCLHTPISKAARLSTNIRATSPTQRPASRAYSARAKTDSGNCAVPASPSSGRKLRTVQKTLSHLSLKSRRRVRESDDRARSS